MDVSQTLSAYSSSSINFPKLTIAGCINIQRRQPSLADNPIRPAHYLALADQHPPPYRLRPPKSPKRRHQCFSRAILCPLLRPHPTSPSWSPPHPIRRPPTQLNSRRSLPLPLPFLLPPLSLPKSLTQTTQPPSQHPQHPPPPPRC
jgi:hypothetical protein